MKTWTDCGRVTIVDNKLVCPNCTTILHYLPWHDPIGEQPVEVIPVFLIKKINRKTKDWFFGCPNFPKCRYAKSRPKTAQEINIKCRAWANSLYDKD